MGPALATPGVVTLVHRLAATVTPERDLAHIEFENSLIGIARSWPYLHDGSQVNLSERVFANTGDRHGTTSALTEAEKTDLVAYLKSL